MRLLGLARTTRNDPEIFAGLVHACRYCGLLEASEAAHREARRLDPHISTSVIYTWWARGDMERVIAETSDAADFELRTMAFEALGRKDEARRTLKEEAILAPVFATIRRALLALLDGREEAAAAFAELAATHGDPEALFMYGACLARVGDTARALATLVAAVDEASPSRGRSPTPGSSRSRGDRLDALRAEAEAARAEAERAFRDAGGPALLGV